MEIHFLKLMKTLCHAVACVLTSDFFSCTASRLWRHKTTAVRFIFNIKFEQILNGNSFPEVDENALLITFSSKGQATELLSLFRHNELIIKELRE